MLSASHTVEIGQPATEVFDFVADQSNESRWHTDVVEASPFGPVTLGDEVRWLVRFMGENEYVCDVVEFENPCRIRLVTREGPLKPTLTHVFEASNGRTRYTRSVQIPTQGLFRLVGVLMRVSGAAKRRNARFAENLKRLLEE